MNFPEQLNLPCRGPRWFRGAALLLALAAAACSSSSSSSSKKTDRGDYGPTYSERYAKVKNIIKNNDFSQRSQFEEQLPKAKTDKEFKSSSFGTKEASGIKEYSRSSSTFKSRDFSGAGKISTAAGKEAHEAGEQNRLASRLFRTPDSSMASKESHDASREFRQGSDTFTTRDNRLGTTALEKDKRPVILPTEKPTYSEDEVRRLLNKE